MMPVTPTASATSAIRTIAFARRDFRIISPLCGNHIRPASKIWLFLHILYATQTICNSKCDSSPGGGRRACDRRRSAHPLCGKPARFMVHCTCAPVRICCAAARHRRKRRPGPVTTCGAAKTVPARKGRPCGDCYGSNTFVSGSCSRLFEKDALREHRV